MRIGQVRKFEELKASGLQMRVYCAFIDLDRDKRHYPTIKDLADYIGYEGKSCNRVIGRCLKFLRDNDMIRERPFPQGKKTIFKKNKKRCGIYLIKTHKGIYVGQSKNIDERWKQHKRDIELKLHRYIHSIDELEFIILEECKKSELVTKELLWANKLHSSGEEVLNKENFLFISEEK